MNLQQLEYIVAVETERHFIKAAESCFVAQATLSIMIKKLEDELNLKIFDRSKQPVLPTKEGTEIIFIAKKILLECTHLKEAAKGVKEQMAGEVHLAVIPTLAPYLLPFFLKSFNEKFPKLKIFIREMITKDIIKSINAGESDIGLLATPVNENGLAETILFYEEFFAYASENEKLSSKKYILPKHINLSHLWLLEEGHCMRNQLINFCELKKKEDRNVSIKYEAGSLEVLIHLVDKNEGITILPQLATHWLTASQKKKLKEFASPKPVREISLLTSQNFQRLKLLDNLKNEIIASVKGKVMKKSAGVNVIEIE